MERYVGLDLALLEIEKYRLSIAGKPDEPPDFVARVCAAIVAQIAGYSDRTAWQEIQKQAKEEYLQLISK
jgi:hypothetical protein